MFSSPVIIFDMKNSGQFETDTDRSHGTFDVCTDAYVQERSKNSSSTEVLQNLNINRNRRYIQIKFCFLWSSDYTLCKEHKGKANPW